MSLYKTGITHGGVVLPEPARQALTRFADAHWGYRQVRAGEGRFYERGLDRVGAHTPGPVGTLVDTAVNLILDIAHVLLILAGMYALWRAISPGV